MRRKSRCRVIQQWKLETVSAHWASGIELHNKIHFIYLFIYLFFLNYIEPNVFPNRNVVPDQGIISRDIAATLLKIKTEGDENDLPRRVFVVERREIS